MRICFIIKLYKERERSKAGHTAESIIHFCISVHSFPWRDAGNPICMESCYWIFWHQVHPGKNVVLFDLCIEFLTLSKHKHNAKLSCGPLSSVLRGLLQTLWEALQVPTVGVCLGLHGGILGGAWCPSLLDMQWLCLNTMHSLCSRWFYLLSRVESWAH